MSKPSYSTLSAFPRIEGQDRTIIPWSKCSMCEARADGSVWHVPALGGTFIAYNDHPTCLPCAIELVDLARKAIEAAQSQADLRRANEARLGREALRAAAAKEAAEEEGRIEAPYSEDGEEE